MRFFHLVWKLDCVEVLLESMSHLCSRFASFFDLVM